MTSPDPVPSRPAEREQLAPEVLESIDALALYWSKTVVREATIRENLISLCREVAAGYAKPSRPPDGSDDVLRPGGAWTPSDVPEQVLKDAKACLSSLLARPKERTKTNHILRVLIANITRRFVWFARDEQAAPRPPEGRPNAE